MGRVLARGGTERARTLTVAEVCEVLRCSRWTVRRLEAMGHLVRVPLEGARVVRYYADGVLARLAAMERSEGPPPLGGGPSW